MQSPEKPLTITIVQSGIKWHSAAENCDQLTRRLDQYLIDSNAQPTDLIVLPEIFNTGFTNAAEKIAETMQGPTVTWLLTIAEKFQTAVCP